MVSSRCSFKAYMLILVMGKTKTQLVKVQSHLGLVNVQRFFNVLGIRMPTEWASSTWRRYAYQLYSLIMYIWQLLLVPAFFVISYKYTDGLDISQLLTSLQVAIDATILPGKIIGLAMNMSHLRQAERLMAQLDARCQRPDEANRMSRANRMCNRMLWFYIGAYGFYATSTFLCAFLLGQPPYSLYLPLVDWRRSHGQFYLQACIEFLIMDWTCLHQSVDDGYAVIYLYTLRTHVQILTERVRALGHRKEHKTWQQDELSQAQQETEYRNLLECIKDHQTLISALRELGYVISATIFVQFLITAAILGTTMINIFIFANTNTKIASIIYFLAVQLQTAPCCYQATCLKHDSENLSLAIFQCNWMAQNKPFRKLLLFFLHRSQQPMTLTAMKLFPINLATNLSIAKFSFSLYTLIKGMNIGERFI